MSDYDLSGYVCGVTNLPCSGCSFMCEHRRREDDDMRIIVSRMPKQPRECVFARHEYKEGCVYPYKCVISGCICNVESCTRLKVQ